MKILVRKFPPEAGHRTSSVIWCGAFLALAPACRLSTPLYPEFRQHPTPLVGEWTDVSKSTPTDSSLWLLQADGNDRLQHLRATAAVGPFVASEAKHYGFWYLQGQLSDPAGRALCFILRPRRKWAPDCLTFELDSIQTTWGPRPRLRLHGYAGEHHIGDRTLLKRGA